MTTEPTGPANDAADPLGPSAPQPEPAGPPRTPGKNEAGNNEAGNNEESGPNIREEQGTHAPGTVPPAHSGTEDAGGRHPEDALKDPDSADG